MDATENNYLSLCRLCASYDVIKTEIFGQEGKERNLAEKIQTCLPVQVIENDPLPKSLCYRCMDTVENYYDFRRSCINAVALLEKLAKQKQQNNDIEVIDVEECSVDVHPEKSESPDLKDIPNSCESELKGTEDGRAVVLKSSHRGADLNSDISDTQQRCQRTSRGNSKSTLKDLKQDSCRSPVLGAQGKGAHPCEVCGKEFSSKGHLALHQRVHTDSTPREGVPVDPGRQYPCDLCHKTYSTSKHRWGHVSTCHRGDPAVTCAECSRVFSSHGNLEEHQLNKHGVEELVEAPVKPRRRAVSSDSGDVSCPRCPKVLHSEAELRKHTLTEHRRHSQDSNRVSQRAQCEDTSLPKQALPQSQADLEGKTRKRSLPYDDVLAALPDSTKLSDGTSSGNRRKSSRPRKIARTESDTSGSLASKLEPESRYTCGVCCQLFTDPEKLVAHSCSDAEDSVLPEATEDSMQPYTCLLCNKGFSYPSALSRHLKATHGIDPCEITNLSGSCESEELFPVEDFWAEEDLIEMVEVDAVEGDQTVATFPCEVCVRVFNDRSSLWLHMLYSHKEQASFACGVCLKVCVNNNELSNHWKSKHASGKVDHRRYICQICGRQHDSRKKLISHVSIHSLDDGRGGVYDPESMVLINSGFYNSDQNKEQLQGEPQRLDGMYLPGDPAHTCELCAKSFPSEDGLVKHKKGAHKQEVGGSGGAGGASQLFMCELCPSAHASKSERWWHVFRCHSKDPSLTCAVKGCNKVFSTRALSQEHMASHHQLQGDTPNTCEVCGKLWSSRIDFWKHMMGVHADCVALTCGVCLKIMCDVAQLAAHVRHLHWPLTGGDFCCETCGRPYSNRSKLSRHQKIHELAANLEEPPSPPPLPAASHPLSPKNSDLIRPGKAQAHPVTATAPAKQKAKADVLWCDACPKMVFSTLDELAHHRRSVHSLFPCDLCLKFYGRSTHLSKHVKRVHAGHPELTCPECQHQSATRANLGVHMMTKHRSGNKKSGDQAAHDRYICSNCSKTFSKCTVFKKHSKACRRRSQINGDTPATADTHPPENFCTICDRGFKSEKNYNDHVEAFHATFQCEFCPDVSVSTTLELYEHICQSHSRHPKLLCGVDSCGRLLRRSSDGVEHKEAHLAGKPAPVCPLCGEIAESPGRMWSHISNQHRSELSRICAACFTQEVSIKSLMSHVSTMHAKELLLPNTCQVCTKQYSSMYKVADHVTKHHEGYVLCKECSQIFQFARLLQKHVQEFHKKDRVEKETVPKVSDDVVVEAVSDGSCCEIVEAGNGEVSQNDSDLRVTSASVPHTVLDEPSIGVELTRDEPTGPDSSGEQINDTDPENIVGINSKSVAQVGDLGEANIKVEPSENPVSKKKRMSYLNLRSVLGETRAANDTNPDAVAKCNTGDSQIDAPFIISVKKETDVADLNMLEVPAHICSVCFMVFSCKDSLLTHKMSHSASSSEAAKVTSDTLHPGLQPFAYLCDECSAGFEHQEELSAHKETHGPSPALCDTALSMERGDRFSSADAFQPHSKTADSELVFSEDVHSAGRDVSHALLERGVECDRRVCPEDEIHLPQVNGNVETLSCVQEGGSATGVLIFGTASSNLRGDFPDVNGDPVVEDDLNCESITTPTGVTHVTDLIVP